MADYKVIRRAEGDEIAWEPGCPVVLTALQVSRNTETSECWLQAKAKNVSGEDAASVYAVAHLTYGDGTAEDLPVEYLDADVAAGSEQNLRPRRLPRGDVRSCELIVTRVEARGETWESAGAAAPLPSREKLTLPARAAEQRAINLGIGPEDPAAGGKVRDHGDWWVCACGQVNARRGSCCSCTLPKAALVANEDVARLLADADKRDEKTYAEAVKLQEQGTAESLTKAIEKFKSLGNLEGCAQRAAECDKRLSTLKKRHTKFGIAISAGVALAIAAIVVIAQVVIPAQEKATKYHYVTEHLSNSDETTYEYLCELKELDYEDAADIYDSLYEWHFELVTTTQEAYEANGFVNLTECSGSSSLYESTIAVLKCWGGHPGEKKNGFVAFECETKYSGTIWLISSLSLKGGVDADDENAYYTSPLTSPLTSTRISIQEANNYKGYRIETLRYLPTITSVIAKAYVDGIGDVDLDEFSNGANLYTDMLNGKVKITPAATGGTITASANQ